MYVEMVAIMSKMGGMGITVISCLVVVVSWVIWRVLEWGWFSPKKLEKCLRAQGLKGTPYRFLVGDLKDTSAMLARALSEPIVPFSNDIVPRISPHVHHIINTYGTNSFSWMGRIPNIYVTDPNMIREILNQPQTFVKNFKVHDPLSKFMFTGLVALEGPKWAKHKKIINPAFTLDKLKSMLPQFTVCYDELLTRWETIAESRGSLEVDVSKVFDTVTFDVISRVGFGSNHDEGGRIFELVEELIKLTTSLISDVYIPGRSYLPAKRNNKLKKVNNEMKAMLRVIIDKRMRQLKAGESTEDDLLGILLASNMKENQTPSDNRKDVSMTIDDVIEECKLFYFAGQKTTGRLLTWTMVLLSKHPKWQERAREEVLRAFGKNKPPSNELNHLRIVPAILNEVLRLYSPITSIAKVVGKDTKLGNLMIPGGTQLTLPSMIIHRDPKIWGDDAMEFNPTRFMDRVNSATKNQVAFLPFSWGASVCIGQSFGFVQAKLGLTMILQRLSWELSPAYVHAPIAILSLQPQYGAPVIYRKLAT